MEDYIENTLNFDDYPLTIYSGEEEEESSIASLIEEKKFMSDFDLKCQSILNSID